MNKSFLKVTVFLVLFFTGCSPTTHSKATATVEQPKLNLSEHTPIIFLHGSGGSENDLTAFAQKIAASQGTDSLMVTIDGNQHLTYLNKLSDQALLPLIFVGFEEGEAPIEEWSQGLAALLQDLTTHYQFETADLVGFSNGGLAAGYFAESFSEYRDLPALNKLVMIGAPFNDLKPLNAGNPLDFKDLTNQDPYFDKFLKKKEQLPSTLNVLAIAGDVGDLSYSDTVVPISSALGSRLIFPEYVDSYQERLSYGRGASHVGLISDNQEVSDWVRDFLSDTDQSKLPTPELITSLKKR
ncbi:alpha/beta hydrolase [uncultured Vagococcus sp.]|uniref:alpha/beta hydrolase n=1 Tax=uncultured Vagococcus sp. TaxID=189676 RepID=UPI0028D04341|nr:alpha/beta hydrolase [uncultured Vagococcus sp.]